MTETIDARKGIRNKRAAVSIGVGTILVAGLLLAPNLHQMATEADTIQGNRAMANAYVRSVMAVNLGTARLDGEVIESPDCARFTWPSDNERSCAVEGLARYVFRDTSTVQAMRRTKSAMDGKGIAYTISTATWEEPSPTSSSIRRNGQALPGGTIVGFMDGERFAEITDGFDDIKPTDTVVTVEANAYMLYRPEIPEPAPCTERCK